MRFQIYWNNIRIGETEFEFGDPPMRVAFGQLLPNHQYYPLRERILQSQELLSVKLDNELFLTAEAYNIEDFTLESGDLLITALAISYPEYETLFPEHCQRYNEQFQA